MRLLRHRGVVLTLCAAVITALIATVLLAPLPYVVTTPGPTADILGDYSGHQVLTITGTPTRTTTGQLRMVTIEATSPGTPVYIGDVTHAWTAPDEAVMPAASVYPSGESDQQAQADISRQMTESQDAATTAALSYLDLSPSQVDVTVDLADVGGPSAGLMTALGIIDEIDPHGGDLTGGHVIAGTGTISDDGTVGAVGGIPLKMQAAVRDAATVFLLPAAECGEAQADLPEGLRLVPVKTLSGAIDALDALQGEGGNVPHC
ncbi:hypothetical protein [Streptomyces fractus]|uniref:hypothetical protein n=1 Tax=Streptomyces fractus TaxID=641806 RepID=UPI003CF36276